MEGFCLTLILLEISQAQEGKNKVPADAAAGVGPAHGVVDGEVSAGPVSSWSEPTRRRPPLFSSLTLLEALKLGTTALQSSAKSVQFIHRFIGGDIDRDLYSQLILDLYYVYATL